MYEMQPVYEQSSPFDSSPSPQAWSTQAAEAGWTSSPPPTPQYRQSAYDESSSIVYAHRPSVPIVMKRPGEVEEESMSPSVTENFPPLQPLAKEFIPISPAVEASPPLTESTEPEEVEESEYTLPLTSSPEPEVFLYSRSDRGKMLLKLKIETKAGGHQTLAVHEVCNSIF
jgi:hypothetical protein